MQVGDPKKVKVLVAVAVCILGVAVFRALPKASAAPASAASGNLPGEARAAGGQSDLPRTTYNDGFSHPALAEKKNIVEAAGEGPITKKAAPQTLPGRTQEPLNVGLQPLPGQVGSSALPGSGAIADPKSAAQPPEGNAGDGQRSTVADQQTLTLVGVVGADSFVAYIRTEEAEPKPFRVGAKVLAGWELASIEAEAVVLRSGKMTKRLKVGQQADL